MQDCYVSVISNLGNLKEPESFEKWFSTIITNKIKDYKKKKSPVILDENEYNALSNSPEENPDSIPHENIEHADNIEIIRKIVPGQKIQYLRYDNCDEEAMQRMIKNKVDADLAHPWVTQEIVDRLHTAGLEVNCWTCDDEGSAQRMINFGVDYMTSNFFE